MLSKGRGQKYWNIGNSTSIEDLPTTISSTLITQQKYTNMSNLLVHNSIYPGGNHRLKYHGLASAGSTSDEAILFLHQGGKEDSEPQVCRHLAKRPFLPMVSSQKGSKQRWLNRWNESNESNSNRRFPR
jgi:hypothetical protein